MKAPVWWRRGRWGPRTRCHDPLAPGKQWEWKPAFHQSWWKQRTSQCRHFYITWPDSVKAGNFYKENTCLLGAALNKTGQCPNALHVDELCGKGWVCGQLGQLLQSLQPSVDTVGLDPLQELTSSTSLPVMKHIALWLLTLMGFLHVLSLLNNYNVLSPNCASSKKKLHRLFYMFEHKLLGQNHYFFACVGDFGACWTHLYIWPALGPKYFPVNGL